MNVIQYIAKLLRTPGSVLVELFDKMEKITGKTGVPEKICEENKQIVSQKLSDLGIAPDKADAQYVQRELLRKTKEADEAFFNFLGKPDFSKQICCTAMVDIAKNIGYIKAGFFIKIEKLRDFLFLNPPRNIMKSLGYFNVKEMVANVDIYEIFAALRFIENEKWLNEFFFRPYKDLTADNFEKREIKIQVLPERWTEIGEKFIGKKLHNLSHLKELGFIFMLPVLREQFPGQSIETFGLLLHYLHEIDFYSKMFKKYSSGANFGEKIVDLLSGKIFSVAPSGQGVLWKIIVRYLAKIDENDPRLFEPHVNPETIHWLKAEKEMDELAQKNPQIKMDFWRGIDDFAGEIFPAGKKGEDIVSFDLVDNVISLTHGGLGKYLYHQQEALWNKIFIEYIGEEKLEEMVVQNLERGYIELK